MNKPSVVLIAGPTGVGKTKYSVEIAKKLGTDIISCDSMQIYRHMDIGTAKVTKKEAQGVVHHMIDVAEPTRNYSVCDYVCEAKEAVDSVLKSGRIPLIVGGTGLYAEALLSGTEFFESAPTDLNYRNELMRLCSEKGNDFIHEMLEKVDKKSSESIHPNNVKRVIRALEYYHITGKTISSHNEQTKSVQPPYNSVKIGFMRSRESLYKIIDERVDKMLADGLLEEVKALVAMGCTKSHTSMQAIGYRQALDYLNGSITYSEMTELIKRDSRRYAKRQFTWFGHMKDMVWINPDGTEDEAVIDKCLDIIENSLYDET